MLRYTLRRIAYLLLVLLGSSLVVFVVISLIPGDPVVVMLGPQGSPEDAARVRQALGLDQPLPVRYALWLGHVLHGDLGTSFTQRQPVAELIQRRLPATLELTGLAVVFGAALGVPAGVVSALRRARPADAAITLVSLLGISLPSFWIGILAILVFSLVLGWLPPSGYVPFMEDPLTNLREAILPSLTLGLALAASLCRFARTSMLEVLGKDYLRTARGKGLGARTVIVGHALRNGLLPLITVLGLQVTAVLSSAVAVEQVFAWPGLGRLALQSVLQRDYTLLLGIVLAIAAVTAFINLAIDLSYGVIDPRLRFE